MDRPRDMNHGQDRKRNVFEWRMQIADHSILTPGQVDEIVSEAKSFCSDTHINLSKWKI